MKRLIYCCGVAIFLLFTANALIACSDDDPMEERTEVPAPPSDENEGDNEGNNDNNNGDDNASMERNITISVRWQTMRLHGLLQPCSPLRWI